MADLNVSILLKLIDKVTGPVRRVSHAMAVAMKGVQAAQLKADKSFERAANLNLAADNIDKVGGKIRAAIGKSVGVAENFEAAMSRVKGVTGANTEEMDKLKVQALDLGAKTVFSASEAADAMYYLGQGGMSVSQTMTAMPAVLSLAAAGNLELGRTAEIAIGVLGGFRLGADQAGRVADVLAKAANMSSVGVDDLAETMSYAAPSANALGVSLEQLAGFAGLLGNVNIKGSRAGTSLQAMFTRLIAPRGQGQTVMKRLGIDAIDKTTGQMRPLSEVLEEIDVKTRKLGAGGQAKALTKIFGLEAMPAAIALMKAGRGEMEKFEKDLKGAVGTAAQVAATNLDNAKGASEQLRGALESLDIALGSVLLPTLRDLRLWLASAFEGVTKWTAAHPALTKVLLVATVALGGFLYMLSLTLRVVATMYSAAGLITLVKAYGGVAKALKFLIPLQWRLNAAFLANPVVLIIAAILALIVVVVLLARHFDYFIGVWERFKNASLAAKVVIMALVGPMMLILGPLLAIAYVAREMIAAWEPVKTFFVELWDAISNGADRAAKALKPITDNAAFDFLVRQPAKAAASVASEVANVFTGPTAPTAPVAPIVAGPAAATAQGPAKPVVGQGPQKQEVGGQIDITINTQTGGAKVNNLKSFGGIDLDVDAGVLLGSQ